MYVCKVINYCTVPAFRSHDGPKNVTQHPCLSLFQTGYVHKAGYDARGRAWFVETALQSSNWSRKHLEILF